MGGRYWATVLAKAKRVREEYDEEESQDEELKDMKIPPTTLIERCSV
jgi:hypothetical protein